MGKKERSRDNPKHVIVVNFLVLIVQGFQIGEILCILFNPHISCNEFICKNIQVSHPYNLSLSTAL